MNPEDATKSMTEAQLRRELQDPSDRWIAEHRTARHLPITIDWLNWPLGWAEEHAEKIGIVLTEDVS